LPLVRIAPTLGVFAAALGLYLLTFSGHVYTVDSEQLLFGTTSLLDRGSLSIPRGYMTVKGREGRHYTKLGAGQSLAAVPFLWLGRGVDAVLGEEARALFLYRPSPVPLPDGRGGRIPAPPDLRHNPEADPIGSFFTLLLSPVVSAAVAALLYWLLLCSGTDRCAAAMLTACAVAATPLWSLSRDFFAHPLETLLLLVALGVLVARERPSDRALLGVGLAMGYGCLVRISTFALWPLLVPLLCWCAVLKPGPSAEARRDRRPLRLALLLLPLAGGLAAIAGLNWARFGSPVSSGYHGTFDALGFNTPLLFGLEMNLTSTYRGLVYHAPPFLLGLWPLVRWRRLRRISALGPVAVGGCFLIYLGLYSRWWAWDGGWCYGPRFFAALLPPLLLLVGSAVPSPTDRGARRERSLFLCAIALCCVAGVAVQLPGALVDYTSAYHAVERHLLPRSALSNLPLLLASGGLAGGPCSWDPWVARLFCSGRTAAGLVHLAFCLALIVGGVAVTARRPAQAVSRRA
jgi:hypothetical protein